MVESNVSKRFVSTIADRLPDFRPYDRPAHLRNRFCPLLPSCKFPLACGPLIMNTLCIIKDDHFQAGVAAAAVSADKERLIDGQVQTCYTLNRNNY